MNICNYHSNIFRVYSIGIILSVFFSTKIQAQFRSYNIVYSDNARGSIAMLGNTLMAIVDSNGVNTTKMDDNSINGNSIYGNDFENMQYVDVDGNFFGGFATRNSSTAALVLPAGTNTIKVARLYWGGRVKNSEFDLTQPANQKIKIRKGTLSGYTEFTATQIDKDNFLQNGEAYTRYQAFADITAFVQNLGTGTYSVGNAPLSVGAIDNGGNYGGWCIVVVYENPNLNYNSIRLYDGFEEVFNNGNPLTTSVTLTGLNVPSTSISAGDASMGVVTWEGDANLFGDFLKINGNLFSNAINPANNPWNGTISNNGIFVTNKNPNYTNQMGIDIDQFDVSTGYGILPNATSATLEFGTEADQYFPGIFSFVIKMKEPTITLDKSVTDANNNGKAEVGEVLTYTLKGTNPGAGNANKVVITDTLPSTVTYVPNSLKVISCPGVTADLKTDAAGDDVAEYINNGLVKTIIFRLGVGANATDSGTLAPNTSYEVQFKVTVNNTGNGNTVPSIINTARIRATSDANVVYFDDGTAIINPEAGALPVTLTYFRGLLQQNFVKLSWETSQEINCKKFDVERSIDGRIFSAVATIAGNGTTSLVHKYSVMDDITGVISSTVYYRLKQVDLDGKANYSTVIAIRLNNNTSGFLISPNPFSSYLNISIDWNKNEAATITLTDASGKNAVIKSINLIKGLNYIKLEELSHLASGNYILQINSNTNKFSQKIIKR